MRQRSWNSPRGASGKALVCTNKTPSLFADKTPSCLYHFCVPSAWERTGLVLGSKELKAGEPFPPNATALIFTPAPADAPYTEEEDFDRLNKQWFNVGYSCTVRGLSQLLPGDGCWATMDTGEAGSASPCNYHRTWWGDFQMRSPRAASVT